MKSQRFGILNSLEKEIISFFECYQLCISQLVFNFFHLLKQRLERQEVCNHQTLSAVIQ